MQHITGAGVLLIENYNNVPVITLFGQSGSYSELGGHRDENESVEQTASRECREESENLIYILPEEILKNGKMVFLKTYVCFVIYVSQLDENDYNHNVRLIYSKCKEAHWKETDELIRISVDNIKKIKNDQVTDVNGVLRKIRGRTQAVLKVGYDIINDKIKEKPLVLYRHIVRNSSLK